MTLERDERFEQLWQALLLPRSACGKAGRDIVRRKCRAAGIEYAVPSNPANAPYSNTTTLTCSNASGCNAGAGDITATCANSTTLPVKLQSFDVT